MSRTERVILVGSTANFFAAVFVYLWLGGDALQGKVENGRYFVANKGVFREVGAALYNLSLLQIASIFLLQPLGMLVTWRGQKRAERALNPEN